MQTDLTDSDVDSYNGSVDDGSNPYERLLPYERILTPEPVHSPLGEHVSAVYRPQPEQYHSVSVQSEAMSIDETTQSRDSSPTIANDLSTDGDDEDDITDDDAEGDTDHSSSEHEDDTTDDATDDETGSFHSAASQANAEAWAGTGTGWQAISTNNTEAGQQASDNQWIEWGDVGQWPQRHQTWQELTTELTTATPEPEPEETSISTVQRIIDDNDPSIADRQKVVDWFQQIAQREPQDVSSIETGEALMLVQRVFAHDENSWKPLDGSGGQQEYVSPFPGRPQYTAALWHQHARCVVERRNGGRLPTSQDRDRTENYQSRPLPIRNHDTVVLNPVNVEFNTISDLLSVRHLLLLGRPEYQGAVENYMRNTVHALHGYSDEATAKASEVVKAWRTHLENQEEREALNRSAQEIANAFEQVNRRAQEALNRSQQSFRTLQGCGVWQHLEYLGDHLDQSIMGFNDVDWVVRDIGHRDEELVAWYAAGRPASQPNPIRPDGGGHFVHPQPLQWAVLNPGPADTAHHDLAADTPHINGPPRPRGRIPHPLFPEYIRKRISVSNRHDARDIYRDVFQSHLRRLKSSTVGNSALRRTASTDQRGVEGEGSTHQVHQLRTGSPELLRTATL